jgi:DNA repair exonuclease SbcCD ATPase subunit
MRQIDSELERQDERAARLAGLAAEVEEVQAVHREVLERSQEVAGHQGALDAAVQASRDDLSALRDDVRKTVERFELENRGLDTVSQRIVDLRGGLGDFEERFRALDASRQAIGNVQASADGLGTRLGAMSKEVEQLAEQASKVRVIGAEVTRLDGLAGELAQRVGRIEDARPAVEGALEELRELNRSREGMRDALEQIRVAHGELQRFREAQSDTQSWLAEVDQSLGTLHANVTEVSRMRPQVELLSKDVERVTASAKAFESRREFVEDLHRRLAGERVRGADDSGGPTLRLADVAGRPGRAGGHDDLRGHAARRGRRAAVGGDRGDRNRRRAAGTGCRGAVGTRAASGGRGGAAADGARAGDRAVRAGLRAPAGSGGGGPPRSGRKRRGSPRRCRTKRRR